MPNKVNTLGRQKRRSFIAMLFAYGDMRRFMCKDKPELIGKFIE